MSDTREPKPRIALTLEPHQAEIVRRVARVQERSQAAVIRDALELMLPTLERVALLGEAMEKATEEQREAVRRAIARTDEELAGPLADAMGISLEGLRAFDEQVLRLVPGPEQTTPSHVITGVDLPRNAAD